MQRIIAIQEKALPIKVDGIDESTTFYFLVWLIEYLLYCSLSDGRTNYRVIYTIALFIFGDQLALSELDHEVYVPHCLLIDRL
jgi:hypothetical protein